MNPIRHVRCNLCGNARHVLMYRAADKPAPAPARTSYRISESELEKPEKIVRCLSCGLVFAMLPGSAEEITRDYADMDDPEYLKEERGRREQARIVLRKILKHRRGGKLLDIGCGPGFLVDEARQAGFEARGVDLSRWSSRYAKEHFGADVYVGKPEDAAFPSRSFDVIVMNDVLEHLEDPKATLREVRRILKNDGVLYLSTPDIQSFLSRFLGAKWWGINKYHLFYFSRRTLEKLFQEVGFKPIRYSSYPRVFSLDYWSERLAPYPWFVRAPIAFAANLGGLGSKLLRVELHDQIGVLARKIQRLDSVASEEEARPAAPGRTWRTIVVLPAYNAEKTLARTVADIPREVVDEILLVDDKSRDQTVALARKLGLTVFEHEKNTGYGGNQKTCYTKALERGADIVVMVHPDYQYDPKIIPQLIEPIRKGEAEAVFGSRMMKGGALEGGMPIWKHNANILLTAFENVVLGTYLTEYHSGFRAYSADLLRRVRYLENSDNFIFDTQIIVQAVANRMKIDEVPIRTRYFEEASSIRLGPSVRYGFGILWEMFRYWLHAAGIFRNRRLDPA